MTQAVDKPGVPPQQQRRAHASRLPWLAFGLLVVAAALATVWQRWSNLAPVAPAQSEKQALAEAEVEEAAPPQPQPEAVVEVEPPPAGKVVERKAYREKRISLAVSATDNDRDLLTYEWLQTGGAQVRIHDADKSHAWFIATKADRYVFEVRVSDGKDTATAQVVRNVKDSDLVLVPPGKD